MRWVAVGMLTSWCLVLYRQMVRCNVKLLLRVDDVRWVPVGMLTSWCLVLYRQRVGLQCKVVITGR